MTFWPFECPPLVASLVVGVLRVGDDALDHGAVRQREVDLVADAPVRRRAGDQVAAVVGRDIVVVLRPGERPLGVDRRLRRPCRPRGVTAVDVAAARGVEGDGVPAVAVLLGNGDARPSGRTQDRVPGVVPVRPQRDLVSRRVAVGAVEVFVRAVVLAVAGIDFRVLLGVDEDVAALQGVHLPVPLDLLEARLEQRFRHGGGGERVRTQLLGRAVARIDEAVVDERRAVHVGVVATRGLRVPDGVVVDVSLRLGQVALGAAAGRRCGGTADDRAEQRHPD